MLPREILHHEIDALPEDCAGEVLDFVLFLREKHVREHAETAILSESSLSKDWLSPEDDAAWQNL